MLTEGTSHLVHLYDVSGVQEEGVNAYYVRPQLSSTVCQAIIKSIPEATISAVEFPAGLNHVIVPTELASSLIEITAQFLSDEGKLLEHTFVPDADQF